MQKGHCINDIRRRLGNHINWWNLFSQMPCQSRFVGFLIVSWQSAREHDSIPTDVLAVHCMHRKHLICFYKNLPLRAFHPTVHLYITECFKYVLRYPILEYQDWSFWIFKMTCRHLLALSWHVQGHLQHLWMQQMQWRCRPAQRDSCRTMDWPNYFSINFLAS